MVLRDDGTESSNIKDNRQSKARRFIIGGGTPGIFLHHKPTARATRRTCRLPGTCNLAVLKPPLMRSQTLTRKTEESLVTLAYWVGVALSASAFDKEVMEHVEVTLKPDFQTVTQLWPPEILGPISTNNVKPESTYQEVKTVHPVALVSQLTSTCTISFLTN